jgi:hypothetical protein
VDPYQLLRSARKTTNAADVLAGPEQQPLQAAPLHSRLFPAASCSPPHRQDSLSGKTMPLTYFQIRVPSEVVIFSQIFSALKLFKGLSCFFKTLKVFDITPLAPEFEVIYKK